MQSLRGSSLPLPLPLYSPTVYTCLSLEMFLFQENWWNFLVRQNPIPHLRKFKFCEFYSHCHHPCRFGNGQIHFPDSIRAKLGLSAEMRHFCEAVHLSSLSLLTPLPFSFVSLLTFRCSRSLRGNFLNPGNSNPRSQKNSDVTSSSYIATIRFALKMVKYASPEASTSR